MKIITGHILIKILEADKRKRFFSDSGIIKEEELAPDMGEAVAQNVQSAEVIGVADDVKHIQVGDIAIIDNIVETLTNRLVYRDEHMKIFCLDTRTEYHDDDMLIYGNLLTRHDVYAWQKGDVDEASLVYGVFREDRLIPNPPYIICEHKDYKLVTKDVGDSKLTYMEEEYGAVVRRVLVPNGESDVDLQPGSFVIVDFSSLYERSMDGKSFDVMMDRDIEMAIE
jgi:hypothetical protein